ncbi:hypothetical protein BGZ90_011638 [Linnemannia elongata]|nr:hypothetical protein BGZ90_011638 [Linnemannia elongata]
MMVDDTEEDDEFGGIQRIFKKGPYSPENTAWLPSRKRVEEDDLYEMLDHDKAGFLGHALTENWVAEKQRAAKKGKEPSLLKAVIINFVNASNTSSPPPAWHGYGLAVGMVALALTTNICYQRWNLGSVKMGIYLRAALINMVYRKATTLSARSHLIYPDGSIVNLMSTDASRIDTAMLSMMIVVSVPIYTTVVIGLLVHLMGPPALLGAVLLILANPIQAWAMSRLGPVRKRASQFTDKRIRLTSEILQGIKVIKFFSWESQFLEKLSEIRKSELANVARLLYIRGAIAATSASLPVMASALTFILYGAIGNKLEAAIIFPALAYFTVLRTPLMVLPSAYTVTVDAYIALKRIQTFLLAEDSNPIPPPEPSHEYALSMSNASFAWDQLPSDTESIDTLVPAQPNLSDASEEAKTTTGSERYHRVVKACSLEADLKLFPFGDETEIGERGVNLSGGQKARLSLARSVYFNAGTVIMDDPLSAVDAHVGKRLWQDCVLTELKGRTRIIATHQLHVLPDVDYVICLKNGRIAEEGAYKDLIAQEGEFCALMAQYGGVQAEEDEAAADVNFDDIQPDNAEVQDKVLAIGGKGKAEIYDKEVGASERKSLEKKTETAQKLMSEEERESGAVKGNVYGGYLKASGLHLWVITFALFALQQLANVMGTQWVSWWSEDRFAFTTTHYIGAYLGFALSQLVLVFFAAIMMSYTIVKTANVMHDAAFERVLFSPLAFFDTTPLGRIINRFSRDVDTLDNVLWSTMYEFTITIVTLAGTFILIIVVFPWMTLAIVPIVVLYYSLSVYYRVTSREVKRLDSNMRSYLYAYFSESLTGLGTLKAYNVVHKAILKNEYRIDLNNRPYYMYQLGARWLSLRVNVLGALTTFSVVILITATRFSINPASAGLILSYLSRISGDLNWGVQRLSTLENNMNSAERLVHYVNNLEQERPVERPENKPPAEWPSQGAISFKNVSMRYRPELPRVLRDISFDIQAGHKVGVVGRTGAGKSSLIQALFLLSELDEGQILMDEIDTTTLGTGDLRPKIAIIPQDPVLFQGTFRYNLDPLAQHTEQELWQVLETSDLKAYVQSQEGGLDAMVSAQGENLSVGQRQLVCLSRALLAKSKVVVLDEATASVDMATDALIQKAIRIDFAHSTVVTVAHRINTIIDYDRILVMHQGQVAEYDTPRNLLSNPDSVFSSMVAETGAQNATHLRTLAGL